MLHDLYVVAFSMATGFTASGIIANLYLLIFPKAKETMGSAAHIGVMIFAGPAVLFQSSLKSMRQHKTSAGAFWLASAVAAYWSLLLGLVLLRIVFVL